jgi:vacuolar-type H+-ATPase subunit H
LKKPNNLKVADAHYFFLNRPQEFNKPQDYEYVCEIMEKVWEELKKIESEAEQIRTEAQTKAKDITTLARQNADKLIANSKAYAEEEGQQLNTSAIQDANQKRSEQLKANETAIQNLRVQAEKHMDAAISRVVSAVVKEA